MDWQTDILLISGSYSPRFGNIYIYEKPVKDFLNNVHDDMLGYWIIYIYTWKGYSIWWAVSACLVKICSSQAKLTQKCVRCTQWAPLRRGQKSLKYIYRSKKNQGIMKSRYSDKKYDVGHNFILDKQHQNSTKIQFPYLWFHESRRSCQLQEVIPLLPLVSIHLFPSSLMQPKKASRHEETEMSSARHVFS